MPRKSEHVVWSHAHMCCAVAEHQATGFTANYFRRVSPAAQGFQRFLVGPSSPNFSSQIQPIAGDDGATKSPRHFAPTYSSAGCFRGRPGRLGGSTSRSTIHAGALPVATVITSMAVRCSAFVGSPSNTSRSRLFRPCGCLSSFGSVTVGTGRGFFFAPPCCGRIHIGHASTPGLVVRWHAYTTARDTDASRHEYWRNSNHCRNALCSAHGCSSVAYSSSCRCSRCFRNFRCTRCSAIHMCSVARRYIHFQYVWFRASSPFGHSGFTPCAAKCSRHGFRAAVLVRFCTSHCCWRLSAAIRAPHKPADGLASAALRNRFPAPITTAAGGSIGNSAPPQSSCRHCSQSSGFQRLVKLAARLLSTRSARPPFPYG